MQIRNALVQVALGLSLGVIGCGQDHGASSLTDGKPTPILGNQVDIEEFTKVFNDYRIANGRTALTYNENLTTNAAENNRLQQSRGLGHHYMGPGTARQNSAWNYPSTSAVMNGWHNSSGHRVNMLAGEVNCFGIHWLGTYWTMNLGRCASIATL